MKFHLDPAPRLNKNQIAKIATKFLKNNSLINLGIGIPSLCAQFIKDPTILLHAENGVYGFNKFASEAASTAFKPYDAINSFLLGINIPTEPIKMAIEAKFAKPHKAKVIITMVLSLIPDRYSVRWLYATNSFKINFSPKRAPAA